MFDVRRKPSLMSGALNTAELIYHTAVRDVRKGHRHAVVGLLMSILQTVLFVATFWLMFELTGASRMGINGDFVVFLMTGIMPFMVHVKAVGAVVKADGPTSPMMQHAPLTTFITMSAGALSALYQHMLGMLVILWFYHTLVAPIEIKDPASAMGMMLLAWFSGVAVGVCFAAFKPWFPEGMQIASSVYSRANMIASGKMFVANSLPAYMLVVFDWNPLFHIIDQTRGYVFINYFPHNSAWPYALWVSITLFVLGMIAENYTRRHASLSWGAGK